MKKIASLAILILMTVLCLFAVHTQAASVTYYQTSKDNIPVWSQASSKSKKVKTISSTGTVLKVVSSTKNSSGNLWYQLSDGSWVYSGNVVKHNHSYKGGICSNQTCKFEYKYSVTNDSVTLYVINSKGAKVWSRPYSVNSAHRRTESYGKALKIVARTVNADGNLWYKLSDGNWVFSGNVGSRYNISYHLNSGTGSFSSFKVLQNAKMTLSTATPKRVGYTFQGWNVQRKSDGKWYVSSKGWKSASDISQNKWTKKLYASGVSLEMTSSWQKGSTVNDSFVFYAVWKKCGHSYRGGICSTCNYEYPLKITAYSATFVVTNEEGAPVRNRPYQYNAKTLKTEKYNSVVTVKAYADNQEGNRWYQLSDGSWIYSGNLTRRYQVTYNANGGTDAPKNQTFLSGKTIQLSKSEPKREGYLFKGWSTSSKSGKVSYKAGASYSSKKDLKLFAVWEKCPHKTYKSGYCTTCNKEYKLTFTSFKGTFVITNTNGASVWSRPYSTASAKVRTLKKGAKLEVIEKTKNSYGNVWYKLSDGSFVYAGNVKQQFTITYDANGGTNAPKKQAFLDGEKPTITSAVPTRNEYIFQGWAKKASSKSVDYPSGSEYGANVSDTLYAVWSKCNHKYSHGICTQCKYSWPYQTKNVTDTVYAVNNSNGVTSYKRPYAKSSEKSKKYAKGDVVVVAYKTTNYNGVEWFKLRDGTWIKASELTKQTTHYHVGDITTSTYSILKNGSYKAQKISGKWFYVFTYNKKTLYMAASAFSGESSNEKQLSSVSSTLSDAVNKKASTSKTFICHKLTMDVGVGTSSATSDDYDIYQWYIYKMTATAGIDTSEAMHAKCKYEDGFFIEFRTKINSNRLSGSEWTYLDKYITPSSVKSYKEALYRNKSINGIVYPEFTVAVTEAPAEYDKNSKSYIFNGYFTSYRMDGKGYAKKSLELENYVTMYTTAEKIVSAVTAFVKPDVAIAKAIYEFAGEGWDFYTKSNKYTSSASYTSEKSDATIYDGKTIYRAYKIKVKSPIRLQKAGDYINTDFYLYKPSTVQSFSITLNIK